MENLCRSKYGNTHVTAFAVEELERVIADLNPEKAPGSNYLTSEALHIVTHTARKILLNIFGQLLVEQRLRKAKIALIGKPKWATPQDLHACTVSWKNFTKAW